MKTKSKSGFSLGIMIMLVSLFGCSNYSTRDSASVSYSDYESFDHYEELYAHCKEIVYKDFELHFVMESPLRNSDLELLVIRNGLIYRGKFEEEVRIEGLPFCLDDGGMLETLTFVVLDQRQELAYMWTRKNSYRLHKREAYNIRLMNSGNYRIKGL